MDKQLDLKDKVTILIVDDKDVNILALTELLERHDRLFLTATNGGDALKIALNKEIDLVILDVQMPDMDGFEVAQILKSNKKTREIPIIFASAEKKEHQFVMKGFEEGAVDYLSKPLNPEITKAKVSVLLKIQLQKRELLEKNSSLEKAALLINNSADVIAIIDPQTFMWEEINSAVTPILGYSVEDVKVQTLPFFLYEEDKKLLEDLKNTISGNLAFETRVYCKNGEIKWLHWHVVVKDGKWFVNARDITGQKNTDDQIRLLNTELHKNVMQLESMNAELESFSYSVSHDLRTPLRAMNGYTKMLLEDYPHQLDGTALRLLDDIQRNADKMNKLISDLIEFSRLGRKKLLTSELDMTQCAEQGINEISRSVQHHAAIKIHPLFPVYGDHALLTQVWINLISNAIKYSSKKEDPVVEIGSEKGDNEVVYYVKDNGAGFDMAYADKLFGVFQRLHSEEEFEGTGIGLASIQRIIKRHGGRVWAEAEKDKGAMFYFSLPVINVAGAEE